MTLISNGLVDSDYPHAVFSNLSSRFEKTASKIIKEKIIDTLNSPEIQTRKLTPVQLNPKVVESDSSDEEFMSLADRARLKKNSQKTWLIEISVVQHYK